MDSVELLLKIDSEKRDPVWERDFLRALPNEKVRVLSPEPREGPDHWPYLMVSTDAATDGAAEAPESASTVDNDAIDDVSGILGWLSTRGIGLVVNPEKPMPDYVLSYGMIWNFRERGEFFTEVAKPALSANRTSIEFTKNQELLVGPPSESYLPPYARSVIKQFFADQGVFTPKVQMVSFDKVNFDLCFSIESLKSPPIQEHANIAEAIAWFLPAHYTVALVSEKVVSGFQPL